MRGFRGQLWDGLFGTLSRRLFAQFARCVTDHAAQDDASEEVVGEMANASDRPFDATFGDGERKREE